MSNKNASVSHQLHDYFSKNQFEDVVRLVTNDIQVVNYATGQVFHGKDEFRAFMQGFKSAFPDMVLVHKNTFEGEHHVALEFVAEATHTGPLATPAGEIPATGKKISQQVCEIHSLRDGKISSIHNYQDAGSLMRQLGLLD